MGRVGPKVLDMAETQLFTRSSAAEEFIASIGDPKTKFLVQVAVNHALGAVLRDKELSRDASKTPFDLLFFAKGVESLVRRHDVLRRILDGEISSLEELDPFSAYSKL